jgi:hypothetical protein
MSNGPYRDDTRYGFPPEAPAVVPWPSEPPWDTPISELNALWLRIECDCGRSSGYPLRLMAARLGWKRTLRTIVPKLICECGGRPSSVVLADRADGDGHTTVEGRAHRLR